MTPADQITHKTQLLLDLHLQENFLARELSNTDKTVRFVLRTGVKYKKKIAKSISHNMRFRNKIINEISELKKQL